MLTNKDTKDTKLDGLLRAQRLRFMPLRGKAIRCQRDTLVSLVSLYVSNALTP